MPQTHLTRVMNRLALMDTSQSIKIRAGGAMASFTFDDFPISAYEVAGRMIEDAGGRATYFASASFMGKVIDGIPYYTPELLREMHAKGHEIGCHSHEHVYLSAKGAKFAHTSAARNAKAMREVLGGQFMMTSFAYPYGDVSPAVKGAMARRFSLCRGVHQGLNSGKADVAQLRIISLESRHFNREQLSLDMANAKRTNSWMIFLTHDISEQPTPYGSTPEMIATTLHLLQQFEIPMHTLKAAGALAMFGGAEATSLAA